MSITKLTQDQLDRFKKGCPAILKTNFGEKVNKVIDGLNGNKQEVSLTDEDIYELDKMCPLESGNIGSKVNEIIESLDSHKIIEELTNGQVAWMDNICYGMKNAKFGSLLQAMIRANNSQEPTPPGELIYELPSTTVTFMAQEGVGLMAALEVDSEIFNSMNVLTTIDFSFDNVEYYNNEKPTLGYSANYLFGGNSDILGIRGLKENCPVICILGNDDGQGQLMLAIQNTEDYTADTEYQISLKIYSNEMPEGYVLPPVSVVIGDSTPFDEAVNLNDYLNGFEDKELIKLNETYIFNCEEFSEELTVVSLPAPGGGITKNGFVYEEATLDINGTMVKPTAYTLTYSDGEQQFRIGVEEGVTEDYIKVITVSIKEA